MNNIPFHNHCSAWLCGGQVRLISRKNLGSRTNAMAHSTMKPSKWFRNNSSRNRCTLLPWTTPRQRPRTLPHMPIGVPRPAKAISCWRPVTSTTITITTINNNKRCRNSYNTIPNLLITIPLPFPPLPQAFHRFRYNQHLYNFIYNNHTNSSNSSNKVHERFKYPMHNRIASNNSCTYRHRTRVISCRRPCNHRTGLMMVGVCASIDLLVFMCF